VSDVTTVVAGVITSLLAGWVVKYIGDDEIERQWHEQQLKRIREARR